MSAPPVVAAAGVRRRYGAHDALKGIDLQISRGEILALLGPNGAGKTTLFEILAGFRERDAGDVRVLGADPASAPGDWRERIGVVLQESAPDAGLTVRECLDLYAGYYRAPREPSEVLAMIGLSDADDTRTEHLSGGQRRRLDVGLALTAVAGAVCFCILGYALATAITSADAAQPTLQAVMLPLYLASGIFIPLANLPELLRQVAALFPVEHLADALHRAFSLHGGAIAWGDIAVLGLWAAAGLAVALRRFSWTPSAAA